MKRAAALVAAAWRCGCVTRAPEPSTIDAEARDRKRSLVPPTNGMRAERVCPEPIRDVLGETSMRRAREYGWLDTPGHP